jgi:hypothetical protein
MNYTTIIVLELFIVAGVPGLPPEYISEHGGVSIQEVFMYFETNILDLPNKSGKSFAGSYAGKAVMSFEKQK